MENMHNEQDQPGKKQMNPVLTGLAGAAIGAGVAALTTRVLSDKKMRGKIADTVSKVSHEFGQKGKELKKRN